jgi:DNA-binding MarR family transcriptional regulator
MEFSDTNLTLIINQFIFTERKKIFAFEGVSLYPSEIHLLLVINRDQPVNATRIADKLGITKGAVSQTITRLQKKGIIIKENDPHNKNELILSLTSLGRRAFDNIKSCRILLQKVFLVFFQLIPRKSRRLLKGFCFKSQGFGNLPFNIFLFQCLVPKPFRKQLQGGMNSEKFRGEKGNPKSHRQDPGIPGSDIPAIMSGQRRRMGTRLGRGV